MNVFILIVVITNEWDKMPSIDKPEIRFGSELEYYNHNIYLFGGYGGANYYNDLWRYSLDDKEWNVVISDDDSQLKPPRTAFHQTCMYKHYFVIFGGKGRSNMDRHLKTSFNDLYLFDTKMNKWYKVDCINKPKGKYFHGMCMVNNLLFIYGGKGIRMTDIHNDVHYINLDHTIASQFTGGIWTEIKIDLPPSFGHVLLYHNFKLSAIYYINITPSSTEIPTEQINGIWWQN